MCWELGTVDDCGNTSTTAGLRQNGNIPVFWGATNKITNGG